MTISEWADEHRRLSSEASAEPGRWRTSRAPHQREIMDALNDPRVFLIVIMSSAQVGKTEILLNILGFYVNYDPSPILLLQPTVEMAETFSKDRLAPMVRDTPALNGIADSKSKSSGNTILHKTFPGGHITMAGANSPASLASRPIRVLLCDEVDRYPASAGTEGDPVSLAKKRTTTFWNSKIVLASTPTVKDESRIEKAYADSTQEIYCLRCPSCNDLQQIKHEHISYTTDSGGHLIGVDATCDHCGDVHGEHEWKESAGEWVARKEHANTRGFHLNEYVSPWRSWLEIESEYFTVKDDSELYKTWVNTSLGETFKISGDAPEWVMVRTCCAGYVGGVPSEVKFLTCGVDVGAGYLVYVVRGWGKNYSSWLIDYGILNGDTRGITVWEDLEEVLDKDYPGFSVKRVMVDSGFRAENVYEFCRKHMMVHPSKGHDTLTKPFYANEIDVTIKGKTYKKGVSLWHFDSDALKCWLHDNIRKEAKSWFVPNDISEKYCKQIVAETRIVKTDKNPVWATLGPNHLLDAEVLSYLAARTVGLLPAPGVIPSKPVKRRIISRGVEL